MAASLHLCLSLSAVSMRHSDVSQVCLQHSGVQASRTSQVRLYQHFFLIYFHTVYILYPPFPKSPFFLRSANPWCLWLFICMPVLHQCLRSYEIFSFVFLMRDSSLKQHTSSGPAQRLATCGIIDYRYQQKRPPQISWVIINSLWTEINLIPSRASFTAGSTLTTVRFAFLVTALDPLDATNQSMIEVSESFTSEKDLCLTGRDRHEKKGGPAADGQCGSARAVVDVCWQTKDRC